MVQHDVLGRRGKMKQSEEALTGLILKILLLLTKMPTKIVNIVQQ
ncbi:hypothetical protein ACVXZ0_08460 [Staphylococcus aureus]